MTRKVFWLIGAVLAAGCGDVPNRSELRPSNLKADLETLARTRIYFGHQSVGNNVLDGLAALASDEQVPLRIVEVPTGLTDGLPGIIHARVGRNGTPQTKCDAFEGFLRTRTDVTWDAALLKFCYADLGDKSDRDPVRLLELYKRTVASVQKARPDLLLVHATSPLLSDGLGKGDVVKKWLGLGTSKDENNRIRNRYNDLLRAQYAGQPLFDVAWAESTRPDGTKVGFRHEGGFFASMAPEFTYDGGHLTDTGRRWVAREFARSLAAALRQRPLVVSGIVTE